MGKHAARPDKETEKSRAIQVHWIPKPQRKTTRTLPNEVANSVTERNFLWLGGTKTDSMTPEINISQYARIVTKYNTMGYRIVPYSRWLK